MSKTFFLFGTGPLIAALCLPAVAQTTPAPKRLADHPAVAVQRLKARQGYDYASKFYPHPAWLYLRGAADETDVAARPAPAPTAPHAETAPATGVVSALARVDVE